MVDTLLSMPILKNWRMSTIRKLKFEQCRIYKLNIMDAMTDRERDLYNIYDKGMSTSILKELTGKVFPQALDVAGYFSITEEDASELMEQKFPRESLKQFLERQISRFPTDEIRSIGKEFLYYTSEDGTITDTERMDRQVMWFENECVRRTKKNLLDKPLIDEIILLKCKSSAMYGILEQIIERGIDINGKHYIFFTSSTGQMKNYEITLLDENYWNENKDALMCGLTENRINEKGGINTGKYFAAKALNISNSILPKCDISIDDVIVVPDLKTEVTGLVNYLDVESLEITENTQMSIPIEHMDGAGIFQPGTLPCSCQIRGGWIKGAVFPFDFHRFINKFKEKLSTVHMIDAWGNPVVIEDFLKAKIILTDSQLKMRKYYDSMEEYRACFNRAGLSIAINMIADEKVESEVSVAYQPFQTIPRCNMTDENIEKLAEKSINYLRDAKTKPETALKMLGINADGSTDTLSPLYKAIKIEPTLLNDIHVQKVMKSVWDKERRKAQGGKLLMDGIWSYICPDLFAFCEWLFLGEDNPVGLVPDGYIYNNYYNEKDIGKVCCLRYPHLSDCEHAVRNVLVSKECKQWFIGSDTIVSCHDLISKVLQADWDGDHICNVHDEMFLSVLGDELRNPLYYEMEKAPVAKVSTENTMICLKSSFNNENIGFVSNAITKIFSEKEPNIELVRLLCAYNNFVIDYFKTQKIMDLKRYRGEYEAYKEPDSKLPYFFKYAKDKKVSSCKLSCESFSNVDKICKYVTKQTKKGVAKKEKAEEEKAEKKFAETLLSNQEIKVNRKSREYIELRELLIRLKQQHMNLYRRIKDKMEDERLSAQEIFYFCCLNDISKIIPDKNIAADYLLDIEYCQPENSDSKKDILWNCYGDVLYENLCRNKTDNVDIPIIKRNAYESEAEKQNKIEENRKKVESEKIAETAVPIDAAVYDTIMGIKTRKDCINDKYLLFVLYVLVKRSHRKYGEDCIRIYKDVRKQKGKYTRKTLDDWIGAQCANKGINRLNKAEYITVEEVNSYTKIRIKKELFDNMDISEEMALFTVTENNPLLDLFEYNKERKVGICEICKRKFIVVGNAKTCGQQCSKMLEKMNKNSQKTA